MDWVDIIRLVGVIIVWLCVAADLALLIWQIKNHRKIDKCWDETHECLNYAIEVRDDLIKEKELYEQWKKENGHLISEEN